MKPFKVYFHDCLNTQKQYKAYHKNLSFKEALLYALYTTVFSLAIILLPSLIVINLMMFVTYMKVWIVYGALIGALFIYLRHKLQTEWIKDYSKDLEFDKIKQLFELKTKLYILIWFGFVYLLYFIFGGYIV
ncbi:hypothetical protein N7603_04195 [Acholeplasma vituli]|uniref:Uncharacterized protein n=1 Tax=Paracholeplasma vituli TaxID=69473 RepID=A0ABT2PYM5_9MOLU|nr:hypothetical protein [Paracholeplasma vituli]MCU0104852.1 hypothetical protein [Paracholeplasma vituli]